jgi:DNA-binding transcriptional ArsR family regulator
MRDSTTAPPRRARPLSPIDKVHDLFKSNFGAEYDMQTADAVLAVAATCKLSGDPPWLMLISGSGNAKSETANSVASVENTIAISTISSEGALLSASKKSKGATGGLLRQLGDSGILIVKDFTSIISGDRKARGEILAALREVHDGRWDRSVGFQGGSTISWKGRIIVIAACTTSWDSAYAVLAAMGPRFVTIRSSARVGRLAAGLRSIRNAGAEDTIRQTISEAVAALIANARLAPRDAKLLIEEENQLVNATNLATYARTGVETDYQSNVIDGHEPEMPTRFSKQLVLIFRGALSIGIDRERAMALVLRCARDSIPPIRYAVLKDLAENDIQDCRISAIARRLRKPWNTIRRTLDALYVLGLVNYMIESGEADKPMERSNAKSDDEDDRRPNYRIALYGLAADVDLRVLGVPE